MIIAEVDGYIKLNAGCCPDIDEHTHISMNQICTKYEIGIQPKMDVRICMGASSIFAKLFLVERVVIMFGLIFAFVQFTFSIHEEKALC